MVGKIDWEAAHQRLARTELSLARAELTDEQREAIFAERAEALAAPPQTAAPTDAFEALVFSLGNERYAFPSVQVREARPVDEITPLPGTPGFVAGLANVRGRIVPVLDLRPYFGLTASPIDTAASLVLLSSPHGDVGVLTTDRPVVRWLRKSELRAPPSGGPAGIDPTVVRGVASELIVVLDADRLLADGRLVVPDER